MKAEELKRQAADLERAEREATLAGVCEVVGIGVKTLQSRERTRDTAKRRAVVAWVLHDRLQWRQADTAAALCCTVRAVKKMLRQERN